MDELVDAFQAQDQLLPNRLPQIRMDRLLRCAADQAKRRDFGDISEACEKLQRRLGCRGQPGQFPDHEVHHIVGVPLGVNAIEIPAPARRVMVKGKQALVVERVQELNGKKRIAARLLVHQLRQRRGLLRPAAQRIRDQLLHVRTRQRRQADLLQVGPRLADRLELARQRMSGIDLVVAVGADQQQVPHLRLGQQILHQIERRRVEPLQIVKEERQRMLRPGEDAEKPPEHQLEAALRLLRRQLRDGRRFADDQLQFGNQIDHELGVRAQRLAQGVAPAGQLGLAQAQQGADQALKGLRQRRIGDVALVLVELAGGEEPARWHQRLVQFMDDGGFADAGISRDQHQLRRAALDDAIEGGEQGLDLARSPVQLLGDQQPVWRVVFAKREVIDAARWLPSRPGSAADRARRRQRSGSAPPRSWRAAS